MTLRADLALNLGRLDLEVALEAGPGEVVAVLGPNGAGKTSLLRALAGLVPLAAGCVELDGRVLDEPASGIRVPPEQRAVGVVFQDYLLFPHLSVLENVAFGLRARGMPRAAARDRAAQELGRVGLADRSRDDPRRLSGGQAQRVALARALATDPALLLLDEPLAALDAQARVDIRRELREHLDAFAGPCLLVTHEPVEAMALADRLVVLEGGRVTQEGSPVEVGRRPRSAWTARLVGLNFYRGVADGAAVALRGGGTLVSADDAPSSSAGGEVLVVVHPSAVTLHRERPSGTARNVWQGTVDGLEARGDRVRVAVTGDIKMISEVTAAAVAELDLGRGGAVWVAVKATEVERYPA